MKILSYNPGHDGAIAYLKNGHLEFSVEAEKNSNFRYSPLSSYAVFSTLEELDELPDAICTGGWWRHESHALVGPAHVDYRGISKSDVAVSQRNFFGRRVRHFSALFRFVWKMLAGKMRNRRCWRDGNALHASFGFGAAVDGVLV